MKAGTREELVERIYHDFCLPVMADKGSSYAQTDIQPDVNQNFKRAGERWGVGSWRAWGVYFGKHIDAIETYVRTGGKFESEPIGMRIVDAINYLFILASLLEEEGKLVFDTMGRDSSRPSDNSRGAVSVGVEVDRALDAVRADGGRLELRAVPHDNGGTDAIDSGRRLYPSDPAG